MRLCNIIIKGGTQEKFHQRLRRKKVLNDVIYIFIFFTEQNNTKIIKITLQSKSGIILTNRVGNIQSNSETPPKNR